MKLYRRGFYVSAIVSDALEKITLCDFMPHGIYVMVGPFGVKSRCIPAWEAYYRTELESVGTIEAHIKKQPGSVLHRVKGMNPFGVQYRGTVHGTVRPQ